MDFGTNMISPAITNAIISKAITLAAAIFIFRTFFIIFFIPVFLHQ